MDFKGVVIHILSIFVVLFDRIDCNNIFGHYKSRDYHDTDLHTNLSCKSYGGGLKVILHSRCSECQSEEQYVILLECNTTKELKYKTLHKLDHEAVFQGLPGGSYKIIVLRDHVALNKTNCCQVKEPDKPLVPNSTPIIVIIVGCVILVLVVIITPCIVINKLDNVSRQNEMSESSYTILENNLRESTTSSRSVYV